MLVVVGVQDKALGERVKSVLASTEFSVLSEEQVKGYLQERLAGSCSLRINLHELAHSIHPWLLFPSEVSAGRTGTTSPFILRR